MVRTNARYGEQMAVAYAQEAVTLVDAKQRKEFDGFMKSALEATNVAKNPKDRGILVNQLYRTVVASAKGIDFGKVPESKGNIMNLQGWKTTQNAIDTLSTLLPPDTNPEVKTLIELHDFLVSARPDFEFGYKYNIELLKTLYCVMVFCMYDLIDTCICLYSSTINGGQKPKHAYAYNAAQQYVALYKSGEWGKMMKGIKDAPSGATEGLILVGGDVDDDLFSQSLFGLESWVSELKDDPFGAVSQLPLPIKIVASVIAILFVTRKLIAFFFRKSASLTQYLHNQAELLDNAMKTDTTMNEKARQKSERLRDRMTALAAFIDTKILRAEKACQKDEVAFAKNDAATAKAVQNGSVIPDAPATTAGGGDIVLL